MFCNVVLRYLFTNQCFRGLSLLTLSARRKFRFYVFEFGPSSRILWLSCQFICWPSFERFIGVLGLAVSIAFLDNVQASDHFDGHRRCFDQRLAALLDQLRHFGQLRSLQTTRVFTIVPRLQSLLSFPLVYLSEQPFPAPAFICRTQDIWSRRISFELVRQRH